MPCWNLRHGVAVYYTTLDGQYSRDGSSLACVEQSEVRSAVVGNGFIGFPYPPPDDATLTGFVYESLAFLWVGRFIETAAVCCKKSLRVIMAN